MIVSKNNILIYINFLSEGAGTSGREEGEKGVGG
jgi:hypothetical protein